MKLLKQAAICLGSISLFLSATAYASVQIQQHNISNSAKIFIQSLSTGKKLYADNAGSYDIIPPKFLKNYAAGSNFVVGYDGIPTTVYCTNAKNLKQEFRFELNKVTNNVISISKIKKDGVDVVVCKQIS